MQNIAAILLPGAASFRRIPMFRSGSGTGFFVNFSGSWMSFVLFFWRYISNQFRKLSCSLRARLMRVTSMRQTLPDGHAHDRLHERGVTETVDRGLCRSWRIYSWRSGLFASRSSKNGLQRRLKENVAERSGTTLLATNTTFFSLQRSIRNDAFNEELGKWLR